MIAALLIIASLGIGAPAWCWESPVRAPVGQAFVAPACRWCPGNRGIEYSVRPGQAVRAVAGGRVSFAGAVAGQRFVTVELGGGWRVTYGRLGRVQVAEGDAVRRGQAVGETGESFIFTVRHHDDYVDPGPFIGQPRARAHLIPADGSAGRPAPPSRTGCARVHAP